MTSDTKYLVNVSDKRATLRVVGHASFLNCVGIGDFFERVAKQDAVEIVVDCAECSGMDSTFLGTLAGGALKIRRAKGSFSLVNLNQRNIELVENLGLQNIMNVCAAPSKENDASNAKEILTGQAKAENILKAHETLVEISPANEAKFEDVIAFLKRETHHQDK